MRIQNEAQDAFEAAETRRLRNSEIRGKLCDVGSGTRRNCLRLSYAQTK